jgi:hypothetical protein
MRNRKILKNKPAIEINMDEAIVISVIKKRGCISS